MAPCPAEIPVRYYTGFTTNIICMTCTVQSDGKLPFWNQNTETCVAACPAETPELSGQCQSCAQVNASTPFWNDATKECVSSCPELISGNLCVTCYEVDENQPYLDVETGDCVSCSDATDGQRKYWHPSARACVVSCPDGLRDGSSSVCSECPEESFWNGKECTSCPTARPKWDYDTKKCVQDCPEDAPIFRDGKCRACTDISEEFVYYVPYYGRCIMQCPEEAPFPDEHNVCRTWVELHPEMPFWDGFEGLACTASLGGEYFRASECIKECPEYAPFADENKFCKKCPEVSLERPLWKDGACVACQEGKYWTGSVCSGSCSGEMKAPLTGNVCVKRCGAYQVYDEIKTKCVCKEGFSSASGECELGQGQTWKDHVDACAAEAGVVSLDGTACVTFCGENEKAVDGVCVCKESSVVSADGDKCVLRRECKRTLVSSGVEACTGEDQCPKGLKLGINGHECVSECALWTLGQTGEE